MDKWESSVQFGPYSSFEPPNCWTIIWILQRTRDDSFHPSQQRGGWVHASLYSHLMDKSWILDWRTFLFCFLLWFCHSRLMLWFKSASSRCAAKRTHISHIYLGQRTWRCWFGCEVTFYPKGAIASEKQRRFQHVWVCVCACVNDQSKQRLINTYSSHWFPVAV